MNNRKSKPQQISKEYGEVSNHHYTQCRYIMYCLTPSLFIRLVTSSAPSPRSAGKAFTIGGVGCYPQVYNGRRFCIYIHEPSLTPTFKREELFRIHGAYVLQSTWRHYVQKRVRKERMRTRKTASTRIQALWRGFWIRSRKEIDVWEACIQLLI